MKWRRRAKLFGVCRGVALLAGLADPLVMRGACRRTIPGETINSVNLLLLNYSKTRAARFPEAVNNPDRMSWPVTLALH